MFSKTWALNTRSWSESECPLVLTSTYQVEITGWCEWWSRGRWRRDMWRWKLDQWWLFDPLTPRQGPSKVDLSRWTKFWAQTSGQIPSVLGPRFSSCWEGKFSGSCSEGSTAWGHATKKVLQLFRKDPVAQLPLTQRTDGPSWERLARNSFERKKAVETIMKIRVQGPVDWDQPSGVKPFKRLVIGT